MARRKKKEPRTQSVELPWYKSLWALVSAVVATVGVVVINLPAFLEGAEKSPGAFERVSGKFLAWHYEDEAWTGYWSSDVEGYVDSEDMNLSSSDLKVHLMAERGKIGGEISAKSICKGVPLLDYLLLDGEVSWGKAIITAYDFVGGKRQDFFRFTAERDGVVLVVKAADPALGWIPEESRIALEQGLSGEAVYPLLHGSCAEERASFMKRVHEEALANNSLQGRRP